MAAAESTLESSHLLPQSSAAHTVLYSRSADAPDFIKLLGLSVITCEKSTRDNPSLLSSASVYALYKPCVCVCDVANVQILFYTLADVTINHQGSDTISM